MSTVAFKVFFTSGELLILSFKGNLFAGYLTSSLAFCVSMCECLPAAAAAAAVPWTVDSQLQLLRSGVPGYPMSRWSFADITQKTKPAFMETSASSFMRIRPWQASRCTVAAVALFRYPWPGVAGHQRDIPSVSPRRPARAAGGPVCPRRAKHWGLQARLWRGSC